MEMRTDAPVVDKRPGATGVQKAQPGKAGGRVNSEDLKFMRELQGALLVQKTPVTSVVLWLIAVIVVIALTWAHFAIVEEITQGEGKVIPASREQVIQSLEGGILEELNVKEGDVVEKGQILLKIDPTRSNASFQEALSRVQGLEGTVARLRSEAYGTPLVFPDDIQGIDSIVHDETQAWKSRQKTLNESVAALKHSLSLAEAEVKLSEPLARQGLISEVEILRLRRQANEFRLQIAERTNRFRADANGDLTKAESELAQAQQVLAGREDVMNRTTIVAPLRGTINNIKVTTRGGVIQQGAEIMTLIPLEDRLLVEAKIKPSDVAFLRPGMPATVKITAYDYAIYGGLQGRVEHISPDTIFDEERARSGRGDPNFYRVYIRTDSAALHVKNKAFPIIPGMVATVEIRTGEKSILSYLLKPVLKAREAFRER
ncbi:MULTISPECIES: HlyD family type I secretion periplasmic adaptor subunit [Tenebrionibacter/Tenebrionicola group]|jgi:adhesin transport system membrane fusion protein|uniref:Membrane fusion protein (MFP) family protein n=2 Tax=Tenebrionibacter/Tenebrionicola group TaxID=2969848 RepID=A0A8K0V3T8_9ENTR|nr:MULTISPECIES: HlyD family type I secretion periplasmic adaptor subunit [Tenebrionibacter/Tenebrionicola group]MBK4716558.1 HlyD family type I secretion periplasmic adaptor subunit [Tenebrionibacter intestinalis]MBV4414547.1 HlyD family type I secretion periplasmic adaptor subunit [Tenebrionicola larvae]MBV5097162.1 HlyD family type I secretion periplasmic adaptor subunit [Tenebrionicola larvae]